MKAAWKRTTKIAKSFPREIATSQRRQEVLRQFVSCLSADSELLSGPNSASPLALPSETLEEQLETQPLDDATLAAHYLVAKDQRS